MIKGLMSVKKLLGFVPKADKIVEGVVTNAKHKKIMVGAIRVIQIGAALYLVSKGFISGDEAINIIEGN
jgi:hypothetical protein